MSGSPNPATLTSAPLRHRLRLELDAAVSDVWALAGNHERLPEYSEGIERAEMTSARDARICHFRPRGGESEGLVLREHIRWQAPNAGYATSAEPANPFGLVNDLSIVTVAASPRGTMFTWEQYYDHDDLAAMRAGFDDGLAGIGRRLVARFGGRLVERYVDGPLLYVAVPE
jgi:hypothetical protein